MESKTTVLDSAIITYNLTITLFRYQHITTRTHILDSLVKSHQQIGDFDAKAPFCFAGLIRSWSGSDSDRSSFI